MSSHLGDGGVQPAPGQPGEADGVDVLGKEVTSPADSVAEPPAGDGVAALAGGEGEAVGDRQRRRARRRVRARRALVGFLVVFFSILLPVTYVVAWEHSVVFTSSGFNRTVVPIGTDPAVTSAAAATITDQIYTSLNAQQRVANVLPSRAAFLAGPITTAIRGYIQDAVTRVLQSSQYQVLWKQTVDFAHNQLLSILKGDSKAVTTTNGQVVLNLIPLLNAVLHQLQGFISGVVGKPVTLPTLTGTEVPASACEKIGAALNRPLPATCGQIPLFPADKLTQARRFARIMNGITLLLLILTPVIAALALWVSRRRRRTLLQLSAGGLLGLVVIRRVVNWVNSTLVNIGQADNRAARRAILNHLFHQYFSVSRWIVIGLVVVFLAALVTGPYPWARALRRVVGRYASEGWNLVRVAAGRARADKTVDWVGSHLDLLRILGVAVAVLLLIILSVSWIGLLIIVVLLAAYEWWLYRVGRAAGLSDGSDSPGPIGGSSEADHQPSPTDRGAAGAV